MKIKYITCLIVIVCLLMACTAKKDDLIKVSDKNILNGLMVQKIVNDTASEEMNLLINDKQKIQEVLTMIEALKVKKTTFADMYSKFQSQDYYAFSFTDENEFKDVKPTPYTFFVFSDGTFFFPHKDIGDLQK